MSVYGDRRDFLKRMAWYSSAGAAISLMPGVSMEAWSDFEGDAAEIVWKKSPCRFCGTGCGLLIGLARDRAVAVKGDPNSPVNKGLCCVKGYHSVQMLYGKDRLTKALVRKNGELVETPIQDALDLVAAKMKETIGARGKDAVAIYGSGQWTIPDGYVATKFFKAGLGTNNIEANARLCMASAVTGFMTTFGLDEPMGCYDDIDHADTFILWGNNMPEMHPILFSRALETRRQKESGLIIDLGTRTTRASYGADKSILFKPQTDLALANAICRELFRTGLVNQDFVKKHVTFKKGKTNIGYGLEDKFKFDDEAVEIGVREYQAFLEDYTPENVEKISGVPATDIRYLAQLYGDPKRKVVSFWCMGMNQHTRGTWINNLVYNLHLLTGKISTPGNSPFSLTGQPSACGTSREVGTFTHRLPHGVVTNEHDREMAAKIWKVPVEKIPAKPTYHTVEMFRALDRGDIQFLWIQATNPFLTMPKLRRYRDGAKKEGRFIVVSDVYPTPTTDIADVILPSALWIEREGMFGNAERRTQHFEKMVDPPGDAMPDGWQLIEVARRLGYGELLPYSKKTWVQEVWEEYRQFQRGPAHEMASYEDLRRQPGVMWPHVNGKSTKWRYNTAYDPAAKGEGEFDFYGNKDHRAVVWQRPYEPPPESPDGEFPFWLCTGRVLEHWHSGSLTRRIPTLHRAVPEAYVEIHPADADRLGIRNKDPVRLTTRRGTLTLPASINGRAVPPAGMVFVPFFDERYLINELTLDAFCPISRQPDYKKCSVKVERA
ncbi:MAG: nitrate reductase catalytic subunit [Candidatus Lindowbacteria bacterium RIFCSPLOWO2_02_FULL_62_12]|nr:MAG: nitrate reductase catalytic subunit [Candidatus Lindowbacteria bacterium RIFCSPLOWO2_02_FULL_62_12]